MHLVLFSILLILLFYNKVFGQYSSRPICTEDNKMSNALSWRETFDHKGHRKIPDTFCPSIKFYETIANSSTECGLKKAHIMVVGGNKGFDCVGWSRMYSNIPRDGNNWIPNAKDWMKIIKEIVWNARGDKVKVTCGACGQCGNDYPTPPASSPPLSMQPPQVTCVEPLPVNYEVLDQASKSEPWSKLSGIKAVQYAALLDTSPKTVLFPSNESAGMGFGIEFVGVTPNKHSKWAKREEPITLVTVDDLVYSTMNNHDHHNHIPTVLTVDTEGYDAHVLLGAARTLASGHVAYIEFEYHSYPPWSTFNLDWIIAYLSNLHYDCYFAGNHGEVWKVTGCENDTPEFFTFKTWSNLVCASRLQKKPHTCWHDAIEKQVAVTAAKAAIRKQQLDKAAAVTGSTPPSA